MEVYNKIWFVSCIILCRSFIPKKDQPLFDILVGNNGEIMQARREQADDELLPDLASASDLEFSTYNSHHPAPIGRFGYVQCNLLLPAALTPKS